MARYFFDIKDGHRLVDPKGHDCASDEAAIAMAKDIAKRVAQDMPGMKHERFIAVVNDEGKEISKIPVPQQTGP